jgi:hypothetical protein
MKIPFLPIALLLTGSAAFAGEMPDPKLTPGATDPQVTEANIKETICKETHFSWTEGHMPPKSFLEGIEKDQLKAYGYADENLKHYQMDHLIPLSLGGNATDTRNIWPQPLIAQWSARRKDFLEEKLHEKVCKGEMGLKDAQEEIRADWIASYKKHLGNGDKHP